MSLWYPRTITSNVTISSDYNVYVVNASSNSITLTLPTITCNGMNCKISRLDLVAGNTVTISGSNNIIFQSASVSTLTLSINSFILLCSVNGLWYTISYNELLNFTSTSIFSSGFALPNNNIYQNFTGSAAEIAIFYYVGRNTYAINGIIIAYGVITLTTNKIEVSKFDGGVLTSMQIITISAQASDPGYAFLPFTNYSALPLTASAIRIGGNLVETLKLYSIIVV